MIEVERYLIDLQEYMIIEDVLDYHNRTSLSEA